MVKDHSFKRPVKFRFCAGSYRTEDRTLGDFHTALLLKQRKNRRLIPLTGKFLKIKNPVSLNG